MRSFPPRLCTVLAMAAMLWLSATAHAQQTYTIKETYSVGEAWAFDVSSTMKLKGQITANGQPFQPIDQDIASHRKGTVQVLAVSNGLPSALRITYDADCTNSGKAAGQDLPAFPLAGKTVSIRKEGDNITNDLATPPDPMTQQELARMLDQDTSMYPKEPVAVNQEWEGDPAMFAKQFQLGPDDHAQMKCRLLAVKEDGGKPVADVSIVGNVQKKEQGALPIESKITLGGVVRFDLKTGHPLTVDVIGKMTMSGAAQVPGPNGAQINAAADAQGELQVHQVARPVNGEPLAGPPGGFDNNLPGAVPAPRPPVMPAPVVAGSPFAGSFKNDQLSLDLTVDGNHATGNMTIAGKPCPITGQVDGDSLTGTFESGGGKFDFTATAKGDTVSLTSGGQTYFLQKAPANPLGAPAPRNPLGQ